MKAADIYAYILSLEQKDEQASCDPKALVTIKIGNQERRFFVRASSLSVDQTRDVSMHDLFGNTVPGPIVTHIKFIEE